LPPADGTFGNSGRAPFRQPGRHQWDITLSKNFYPTAGTRVQVRADFINAFDQVQWQADPVANDIRDVMYGLDRSLRPNPEHARASGDPAGCEALLVSEVR